jgi:hypothetical protein
MKRVLQLVLPLAAGLFLVVVGYAQSSSESSSDFPQTIVVTAPVDAYDSGDSDKLIGKFQGNSELKVTEYSDAIKAYRVEYTDKGSGSVIRAWCKAADIGSLVKTKAAPAGTDARKSAAESMFVKPDLKENKTSAAETDPSKTLKARIGSRVQKRDVLFGLSLQNDETQDFIRDAIKNKKKLPANLPKFKIVDESDKVVGTGRFEYG